MRGQHSKANLPDFELILVDDGSPDRCGEICDGYARQDSRVRVIHKENGVCPTPGTQALIGWKPTATAGADFADSDDWYTRSCLPGCWTPPRRLI